MITLASRACAAPTHTAAAERNGRLDLPSVPSRLLSLHAHLNVPRSLVGGWF